ncbi:galactose-binding like protein [Rhizopus microsporus var. microsporus]|uniref:Nuclear receptor 2C2-associated protein n=2 Tax=Rhizopus microsporus TaxID=58291 RepID=A0A2G4TA06_RHIZD|nr:galactose-binding domain-containing protein [Rhizopus microsporus ATCC 52813]ORE10269.1 galactose-binding like protein [Rhizopus microsporus var. microsporus]PHZ17840.1 galactose-binding domain-containing protein [Rhizopus microsporus ATCC 52813]
MTSLINPDTRIKVSSVLNRDTVNFGKQHLIDGNEETCWNSEQGLPQHILIDFPSTASVSGIAITFQGGFAGKKCQVLGSLDSSPNDYSVQISTLYPEDISSTQTFTFDPTEGIKRLKIVFEESTDFYGRITVYKLDILGNTI